VAAYRIEPDAVQWGVVLGASLAAAILDVRTRRIPNSLTLPLAVGGLVYAAWTSGIIGLGESAAACLLLALPYVILFAVAGGGAGDAKMMGAIGAWLGLRAGIVVLVAVAITGGVFGLLRILAARERGTALSRLYAWLYVAAIAVSGGRQGWALLKSEPGEEKKERNEGLRLTIPYGPAIFIGACIGAWVVHSWIG